MSEFHALSGAYAIDALDELERARFERHLAECTDCQSEVDSLREAAAALAEDTAVTPPPALRDAVLAGIRTVRPLPPVAVVTDTAPRRRRWFPTLLVAAAAVFALGAGVTVWQPWQDQTSQVVTAADRVIGAPDAARLTQTLPGGAQATLVRSKSQGRAVLMTENLPPPPAGMVYQLWLGDPAIKMVSAGLLPARATQTVVLDGDAASALAAAVSIEPAGGSVAPTSDPILVFDFAQLEDA